MQNPRIIHLNCGTLRTIGFFPFSTIPLYNQGKYFGRGTAVLHCLLVDTGEGLLLVDTGYGTGDYTHPAPFERFYSRLTGLQQDIQQTALHQIQALGYSPADVKYIFLTHMHFDHCGGLPDFPAAQVHVYEPEHTAAMHRRGLDRLAYCKQHWAHNPDWVLHTLQGETWHGLQRTRIIRMGQVETFLLPMPGHSAGCSAVAVSLPDGRCIIHAGDTYGYHGLVDPNGPFYPRFQWLFKPLFTLFPLTRPMFWHDHHFRRLKRELGDRLEVFPGHDPHDYERLSGEKVV